MSTMSVPRFFLATFLAIQVSAHGGHEAVPEGEAISGDPIDSTLWLHMIIMGVAFGIIFPFGMVLGIIRSRWHVPVQVVGTILAVVAYFMGHAHKGRQFAKNVHASFANSLMLLLIIQVVLGVYLKLHLEKGINGRIRRYMVLGHGVLGKAMPVVSWVQMLFGGITALGFCRDDHLGQCLAHFIMGSAFIAYGIVMTILLLVGQFWLRHTGRSQEFFDSLIIAAWGCVNTFTEHRWGGPWVHNDLQHTTMGIVWWCAGLLGMWLSRKRNGRPKRNLIPAIVILLTGYGMSAHPQNLPLSTMVHTMFGYTLMAAGLTRIIEISFVLRDQSTFSLDGSDPHSFQYLPPFLLYASGFLFMGATEEQMQLLSDAGVTHVSYILILYSVAFILFLFVNILLHLYAVHAFPESAQFNRKNQQLPKTRRTDSTSSYTEANGTLQPNGYTRSRSEAEQVHDAEAFELQGLISDDEYHGHKEGDDDEDTLVNPK
ncbi:putative integral membrane protein [Talaromyces proteolyticus]|uniref:Integral membrane protein n=1 Tax=Talaromyces proteolyticus TaxID=1131652 RepID=A0AAD4KWQ9_9EURO|nr:putative integral membrane protein [Talaromyces proteolyticus]KAH8702583.1 putative integral membrane protein [Talaromyces proteolyticus]